MPLLARLLLVWRYAFAGLLACDFEVCLCWLACWSLRYAFAGFVCWVDVPAGMHRSPDMPLLASIDGSAALVGVIRWPSVAMSFLANKQPKPEKMHLPFFFSNFQAKFHSRIDCGTPLHDAHATPLNTCTQRSYDIPTQNF